MNIGRKGLSLLLCALITLNMLAAFVITTPERVTAAPADGTPEWVSDSDYWNDARVIGSAEDFYALARIINRASPSPADFELFTTADERLDKTPDELRALLASSKYILSGDITLDAADFTGIGTASGVFGGEINGAGYKLSYSAAFSVGTASISCALFPYAENALFYNLKIVCDLKITNTSVSSTVVTAGCLVGTGSGDMRFHKIGISGSAIFSTSRTGTQIRYGGLAGAITSGDLYCDQITLDVARSHVTTGSGAYSSVLEGKYTASAPALEAGKLAIHDTVGLSVVVFGIGVTDEGGGIYSVSANTRVFVQAVNENAVFARWYSVSGTNIGTVTNACVSFLMPAGGTVLSAYINPIAAAGTEIGKTFGTPFQIKNSSDLSALSGILDGSVSQTDFDAFGLSVGDAAKLQTGYFKITADINAPADFTGLGGTLSFSGFIDGGYYDGGVLKNRTVVIPQNSHNASAYCGLIKTVSGVPEKMAIIRNVTADGEFVGENTGGSPTYYGGIAGKASYTIFDGVKSSVKLAASKTTGKIYLGGIAGSVSYCFVRRSEYTGSSKIQAVVNSSSMTSATASAGDSLDTYVGGAFGEQVHSVSLNVTVKLGYKLTEGYQEVLIEGTGVNSYAGGFCGILRQSTSTLTAATIPAAILNCAVTGADASDTGRKTIRAVTGFRQPNSANTVGLAYAGGFAGYINVSAVGATIKGVSLDAASADYDITATDNNSDANDRPYAIAAGGFCGVYNQNAANCYFYADKDDLFKGKINVMAQAYGVNPQRTTTVSAGGVSGQGLFATSGMNFDISQMTVKSVQKFTNSQEVACFGYAGGICGLPQAQNISNLTVTAKNASVEAIREPLNAAKEATSRTAAADFSLSCGGLFGQTVGSYALSGIHLTFTDSQVSLGQLSYASKHGNVGAGGLIGMAKTAVTLSNVSFTALGTTAVKGSSSTGLPAKNTHGTGDIYVGGLVGYMNGGRLEDGSLTGSYATNGGVKTVSLVANQSSNSPCVGGIVGFAVSVGSITRCTVDNAYIFGEAYNDTATATDTDIIVGGALGLANGSGSSTEGFISKSTVKNSKIEAQGREYTLTYAAGIIGSRFSVSTTCVVSDCVSFNNYIYVEAQKKWAAGAGIIGYFYDKATNTIVNCASINDKIEVLNTGIETTLSQTSGFDATSTVGGIAGRTNAQSVSGGVIINCYSNAKLFPINPFPEKTYRGGIIGNADKIAGGQVIINNSYFHAENAGTLYAVNFSVTDPAVCKMMEGVRQSPSANIQNMGTQKITSETLRYCALDFLTDYINGERQSLSIFEGMGYNGVSVSGISTRATSDARILESPRSDPPLPSANVSLTKIDASGTGAGFTSQLISQPDPAVYVDVELTVTVNGVSYAFGSKPVFVGNLPDASQIIFHEDSMTGPVVPQQHTITVFCYPGIPEDIYADVIYTDGSSLHDVVIWEFSETADFTQVKNAMAMSPYAGVNADKNRCTIKPDIAIDDDKIFYMRARTLTKNKNAGYIYSTTVKIVIVPVYVTGIYVSSPDAAGTKQNPLLISSTEMKTVGATVEPWETVTLKSYTFVGYKLDAQGNPVTSQPLKGVKADGTLDGIALSGQDGIKANETFVIFAVSNGKSGGIADSGCTVLSDRRVQSPAFYAARADRVNVVIKVSGGTIKSTSGTAFVGQPFTVETIPGSKMNSEPSAASYQLPGSQIPVSYPLSAGDTAPAGTEYAFYQNAAPQYSSMTFKIPETVVSGSTITIVVGYFAKVRIIYMEPFSRGILTDRDATIYVREADVITEESIKTAAPSFAGYLETYSLAGWYGSWVTKPNASLSDYGTRLTVSSAGGTDIDGNPVYNDLLPVSGLMDEYNVYARLQYRARYDDSASMHATVCANADASDPADKTVPVDCFSDFVFKLNPPADYIGTPRCSVGVGGVTLARGASTYSAAESDENLYTINRNALTFDKLKSLSIVITTYHTNLEFVPAEGMIPAAGSVPRDGMFTYIYNVNHAKTADKMTYAFKNPDSKNDLKITFSSPLPADTLVEIHRKTDDITAGILWYRTEGTAKSSLALGDFTLMGTNEKYSPVKFSDYIAGDAVKERFYIVITPPMSYNGDTAALLSAFNITVGFDPANLSGADDIASSVAAAFNPSGLQTFSLTKSSAGLTGGTLGYNVNAAPANNGRHTGAVHGFTFYYVDSNGAVLPFANGSITFRGETQASSSEIPLYYASFAAGSGSYAITKAPDNAAALIIEHREAAPYAIVYDRLDPLIERRKLFGGVIRNALNVK